MVAVYIVCVDDFWYLVDVLLRVCAGYLCVVFCCDLSVEGRVYFVCICFYGFYPCCDVVVVTVLVVIFVVGLCIRTCLLAVFLNSSLLLLDDPIADCDGTLESVCFFAKIGALFGEGYGLFDEEFTDIFNCRPVCLICCGCFCLLVTET